MNISVSSEFDEAINSYLEDLYNYYENKTKKKKQDWEDQINRSKYKCVCQTYGENKCNNGHTINCESICCTSCKENGKDGIWICHRMVLQISGHYVGCKIYRLFL